jgi:membrane protease YdiL (CAAX protease family)
MKFLSAMPTHRRLILFLLGVLALTCVISPWLALGADWLATHWSALLSERVPFSRVFNRAFMISGIVLFILLRRFFIDGRIKELISVRFAVACRTLFTGLGLAIGSMILLVVAMTASDIFTPYFRVSLTRALTRIASATMAGISVGAIEELFFRGILFKGLHDKGNAWRAYIAANLFYSVLHFVKPGEAYFLDSIEPLAGFSHLLAAFRPFLDPLPLLPGIFGLFVIGLVLSYALVRTGNLYLGIGLHAGWVFSLKTMRVFGDFTREDLSWAFGATDPKIVSGVATWFGILLVGVAVHCLTRKRDARSTDPRHAKAV